MLDVLGHIYQGHEDIPHRFYPVLPQLSEFLPGYFLEQNCLLLRPVDKHQKWAGMAFGHLARGDGVEHVRRQCQDT